MTDTPALSNTFCPTTGAVLETESVTLVFGLTIWLYTEEVLGESLVSPP